MNSDDSRAYVEENAEELRRLRSLVERLSDDDLIRPVTEHWTVASALGHLAFWDSRAIWLAGKIERGEPFAESDAEPDDVDWLNDSIRPFIDSIPPREAADLAVRMAEEADGRVAALDPGRLWPANPASHLNAYRAEHRREHLDEIEAALKGRPPFARS